METIGLVGGAECETALRYVMLANELVRQRRGGLHSARCVLFSPDMAEIEQLQASGRWSEAASLLADAARALRAAGAGVLLLCGVTLHQRFEMIRAGLGIPVLHVGDAVAAAARAAGARHVGLIGAGFDVEIAIYRERLGAWGVGVLLPDATASSAVRRILYEGLCRDAIRAESRGLVDDIVNEMVGRGAQGIVLACPAMEQLVREFDCPVPVFPATRLHAGAAVDWALSIQPSNFA